MNLESWWPQSTMYTDEPANLKVSASMPGPGWLAS